MKKDTFGLKIFGRDPPSKRMTEKSLKLSKKRQEKEETKKKLEEEKKRQEEEETRLEEEVESDHHGRIYVDYRVPRPSNFPVSAIIVTFLTYLCHIILATIQVH